MINFRENVFLDTCLERESITVYLGSGVKLTGRLIGYDDNSINITGIDGEQMIYKDAIATIQIRNANKVAPAYPNNKYRRYEAPSATT